MFLAALQSFEPCGIVFVIVITSAAEEVHGLNALDEFLAGIGPGQVPQGPIAIARGEQRRMPRRFDGKVETPTVLVWWSQSSDM